MYDGKYMTETIVVNIYLPTRKTSRRKQSFAPRAADAAHYARARKRAGEVHDVLKTDLKRRKIFRVQSSEILTTVRRSTRLLLYCDAGVLVCGIYGKEAIIPVRRQQLYTTKKNKEQTNVQATCKCIQQ